MARVMCVVANALIVVVAAKRLVSTSMLSFKMCAFPSRTQNKAALKGRLKMYSDSTKENA